MPIALYDATVSVYLQVLPALVGAFDKGEAHCRAKGLPDIALTEASLAPDMWPFARQVNSICMHSAGAVEAALSGDLALDRSEPPTDFPSLKARLNDAIARLKKVTPDQLEAVIDGNTGFVIAPTRRMDFVTKDFLLTFALPNFTFHATTAYAILRANGVDVGKRDFLGAPRAKMAA